jgi:phosphatidylglycerophosphate synthase
MLQTAAPIALVLVMTGENPTRIWGMTNAERVRRLAANTGVALGNAGALNGQSTAIVIDAQYGFDPLWFTHLLANPGLVVTDNGHEVMAHYAPDTDMFELRLEDKPTIYNHALRKQMQPFCAPLTPQSVAAMERESYDGAYKGVTDILTKYVWRDLAYHLTRGAARIGLTPNMVSIIGLILCIIATVLFGYGQYGAGLALAFIFMVLDTVDGKLARCTITSSAIGNFIDHGVDLVHPPFWYYFWAVGLGAWGLAFDPVTFWFVQGVIFIGYVAQRLLEGWFIQRFGIHMHVWRKFDSDFRLITARRNPNFVLLLMGTVIGRPDWGLIAVAIWTVISLLVHIAQTVQAEWATARGEKIQSWLLAN